MRLPLSLSPSLLFLSAIPARSHRRTSFSTSFEFWFSAAVPTVSRSVTSAVSNLKINPDTLKQMHETAFTETGRRFSDEECRYREEERHVFRIDRKSRRPRAITLHLVVVWRDSREIFETRSDKVSACFLAPHTRSRHLSRRGVAFGPRIFANDASRVSPRRSHK